MSASVALVDRIDAALPQTQCTRCGYPDCRAYAQAIVDHVAAINRCPPGGADGIERLAALTGHAALPLDPAGGTEGPRFVAVVDEARCIGCTLCIQACPVDCIVGAPKRMHTVIEHACTGCELCLPVCPVDCIDWVVATPGSIGWLAWSDEQAQNARSSYRARSHRLQRDEHDREHALAAKSGPGVTADDSADRGGPSLDAQVIAAALARAAARKAPS